MKKLLLLFVFFIGTVSINAQTKEELKAQKAEKQAEADKFQGEADDLQSQIDALPGWRFGVFGTIGGSLSGFDNWYSQGTPNNSSGSIGFTVNADANLIQEKFFWRNSLNLNLNWIKLNDKDNPLDNDSFEATTDVFNISSLYGRNINKNWAVSGLMEYRTTLIDNFNDPGYLDLGVGITWLPIADLVVVIHPLNYNFVFSDEDAIFESSLGAKILADYNKSVGDLNISSNLSIFMSYEDSNLSNWTWTNALGYTFWKGIGVGFEFGLRDNKQEALNYEVNTLGNMNATFDNIDNDLQTFWTFGLSYDF
jgi:hypothetical protein